MLKDKRVPVVAVFAVLFSIILILSLLLVSVLAASGSYTNLVPTSIDTNGSIFNGTGSMDGYRLSSSGGLTGVNGGVVSGFIPYTFGGVIRVKGSTTTSDGGQYVQFYDDNFNLLVSTTKGSFVSKGCGSFELQSDGTYLLTVTNIQQFFLENYQNVDASRVKYIRVSIMSGSSANFTVTIDEEIKPATFHVTIDGGGGFTISQYWDSVDLTLIVNSDGYRIFASDYEEEYSYSESYNSVGYQFAGLTSHNPDHFQLDYAPGSRYNFTLDRTSPFLSLHSLLYTSSLTIDPNGGTWNGSTQPFIVWDFCGNDFDPIPAPIRPGFVFEGWTLSGTGTFNEWDPNYLGYTFGDGHGVLTANWIPDPELLRSATITIVGAPYTFTDYGVMPSVQFTVTSSGAVMSYGSQSYTFTYSGSGTFTGLSFAPTGDPTFLIGQTYALAAGDHVLYCCVADAPSTYILKAGQWECKSLIMTGEYIELPAWPSGLGSVPFSFVSSGQTFSSMSVGTYLPTSQTQLLYGSSAAYRYLLGDLSGGFTNTAFAFVYLTSDQVVPKEFYDWFVSSFNRVSDSPVSPTFSTVVNLYDSSGLILYATYTISGSGTSPIATGTVLANGVEFVDASGKKWSWTLAPDPFLGFSFGSDSYAAVYPPGSTFEVGGVYSDFILNLYLTQKPDDSQYQSGVLGILERIFDALRPSSWLDLLNLVDFGFIGDIFSTAYRGLNGFFGLQNFVNDPAGPFGWLKG